MCFFLPISPLSEVFRPEDEPPAYHGAYRGTVNVVKVVDHTSSNVNTETTLPYQDGVIRVIPRPKVESRAYYDKSLPPFPPQARVSARVDLPQRVSTPAHQARYSASSGSSTASMTKPQPELRRRRRRFGCFR